MSDVVTENPLNRHVSWEALESDITPISAFFCRNHNPFPTPPTALEWAGNVLTLDMLAALPQVEHVVTLECAGNGRTEFEPVPSGTPWGIRGMSTGRYRGVALETLLKRFEPAEGDQHIIFQGADEGKEGFYERSLFINEAVSYSAFVALEMNGEPLPPQHGAPFRLVVPQYYAMTSIKWLFRARYSAVPSQGYYQVEDYLVKMPDANIPTRPATTMRPKSILVAPQQSQSFRGKVEIRGKAWSGEDPVTSVELEFLSEAGVQQFPAVLGEDLGPYAWRPFSGEFAMEPGKYTVRSFCKAGDHTQPVQAPWNSQGYENNSAHSVEFEILE